MGRRSKRPKLNKPDRNIPNKTDVPLPTNQLNKRKAKGDQSTAKTDRGDGVYFQRETTSSTESKEIAAKLPFCCETKGIYRKDGSIDPDNFISPGNDRLFHNKLCHKAVNQKHNESDEAFEERMAQWKPPITAAYEKMANYFYSVMDEDDNGDETDVFPKLFPREWVEKNHPGLETACNDDDDDDEEQDSAKRDAMIQMYLSNRRNTAATQNDSTLADDQTLLWTSEQYQDLVLEFNKRKKCFESGKEKKSGAVVLDVFAGIGTGSLALKKLGIRIDKIIYVEHDKVATHVFRENHDPSYNPELNDDGIEYFFYSKWEDLFGDSVGDKGFNDKVKEFVAQFGPVDIVLGGPPCTDYSQVNAKRKGTTGDQGKYLLDLFHLIQVLKRLQNPHPLYFLVENVKMQEVFEVHERSGLEAYPVNLCAKYLSPTRRDRLFWFNFPCPTIDRAGPWRCLGPNSCLEEGFIHPTHLVDKHDVAKCNCFMASKSRLDEPGSFRMYVFLNHTQHGKYICRPLKAVERERMMGFPAGYVTEKVSELFGTLLNQGLSEETQFQNGSDWRLTLDEKLHVFKGNYHGIGVPDYYRVEVLDKAETPKDEKKDVMERVCMFLKLSPPPPVKAGADPKTAAGSSEDEATCMPISEKHGDTDDVVESASSDESPEYDPVHSNGRRNATFFNEEDYSKHLIGNAFSMPVVETLLSPLRAVFASSTSTSFQYRYSWQMPPEDYFEPGIDDDESELRNVDYVVDDYPLDGSQIE